MAMQTPSDDGAIFPLAQMAYILAVWFVGHDDAVPPEDRVHPTPRGNAVRSTRRQQPAPTTPAPSSRDPRSR